MKYAKIDLLGNPIAFYSEDIHGTNIPEGVIAIDQVDWLAHINGTAKRWNGMNWVDAPPIVPTIEALSQQIRSSRDWKIKVFMWRIQRNESEVRLSLTPTDSIVDLDNYVQALRDLPLQPGFPWNGSDDPECPWPTEP